MKLEPNIKLELRVVHGLSQISNEQVKTEINRSIYSFYTYNNVGHSIYKMNTEKSIDFEKYAKFISCVYDIYSKEKTEEENLYIKANMNSPRVIYIAATLAGFGESLLPNVFSGIEKDIIEKKEQE